GEEPYYIDQLADAIVEAALTEDERDFNLSVYYGSDANVREVISTCQQYPTFADRRVVVLREAQNVGKQPGHAHDMDLFKLYAERPLASTVLVICNKGGAIKAKPFTDQLKASGSGVVFDSARVRTDRDLQAAIANYATSIGAIIDVKSIRMLADFIGNDLSRMFGELDKLRLLVDTDNKITPELIERNIGISKDFNNFELEDALRNRDALKAYRIIDYFERNPKNNPVVVTVSMLFSFFSSVLLVRAAKDKSPEALMAALGTKSAWRVKKCQEAASRYTTQACVNIIGYLRECDARSKGVGSRQDAYKLLHELIFKILHS
ncbi:MAG: DNA polymerase III subunit delta, partial [Muribaculaceae bacterium]|nr:DNA polymerase III subunit delta [Muribaculaceae bacterium]